MREKGREEGGVEGGEGLPAVVKCDAESLCSMLIKKTKIVCLCYCFSEKRRGTEAGSYRGREGGRMRWNGRTVMLTYVSQPFEKKKHF